MVVLKKIERAAKIDAANNRRIKQSIGAGPGQGNR